MDARDSGTDAYCHLYDTEFITGTHWKFHIVREFFVTRHLDPSVTRRTCNLFIELVASMFHSEQEEELFWKEKNKVVDEQ